jgi:hypothetical protein
MTTTSAPTLSTINLDQIIAGLPAKFQPWATQYAPAFLAMTATEFQAWLDLLVSGDVYTAYRQVIAKLPNKEAYLAKLDENALAWSTANAANNASLALQRQAGTAFLGILLTIGLAVFGF